MAAAAMLAASPTAWADNVVTDGDLVTAGAQSTLDFGAVCAGTLVTKPVLVGVQKQGNSTGPNVYLNGSTVTFVRGNVSGTDAASVQTPPFGLGTSFGTVTLPSTWQTSPNNTQSATVSLPVRLDTRLKAAGSTVSAAVDVSAKGFNTSGAALTRTDAVTVTARVVSCDTTPPQLSLPSDITVEAGGPSGTIVSFDATATDASPASPAVTCAPGSGSLFPLGSSTVDCSATDAAGNTARESFTVTVRDSTGPVIGEVNDLVAEAASASGAVVDYATPFAEDLVTGPASVSCLPASGTVFPLGQSTVTCTATDGAAPANESSRSFTVLVDDTTAPTLLLPADVVAEATQPAGAEVAFVAGAHDAVDGDVPADCSPGSGATFSLGTTAVECSATDAHANTATGSFAVTVQDTTPPAITGVPGDVTAEATGPAGAAAAYASPSASDLVDGDVPVTCLPASGEVFPLGGTTVTCSASDTRGNTDSRSFVVTVQDTTAPTLNLPTDLLVAATGPDGATAPFEATAEDSVSGSVPVTCSPASGDTYAIGETTVQCSAADAAGNTVRGSFTVLVQRQLSDFQRPVDSGRTVNTVKAGATVPIKFEVFAGSHEYTTTDVLAAFSVKKFTCDPNAPLDAVEVTTSGNTSLRYDSTGGFFIQNWKVPAEKNVCYQVAVETTDGAVKVARFKTV